MQTFRYLNTQKTWWLFKAPNNSIPTDQDPLYPQTDKDKRCRIKLGQHPKSIQKAENCLASFNLQKSSEVFWGFSEKESRSFYPCMPVRSRSVSKFVSASWPEESTGYCMLGASQSKLIHFCISNATSWGTEVRSSHAVLFETPVIFQHFLVLWQRMHGWSFGWPWYLNLAGTWNE